MLLKVCLFQLFVALITAVNSQISLSSLQCEQFRHGRVVGGSDAARGSIPYIASLTRRGGHFCGATVLNNKWLLTAAHCMCTGFGDIMQPHRIKAILGLHAISEYNELKKNATDTMSTNGMHEIAFQNVVIHPDYSCTRPYNDIALLEISEPIAFSKTVRPICIASNSNDEAPNFDNEVATIAGWGHRNETLDISNRADKLQKAEVEVWTNKECQLSFDAQQKKQKIQSTQMCAGRKNGGIDACWADSGGPMVSNDGRMIIGIVSTGIGCARPGLPGIYTRVTEYSNWIQDVVTK